jgi:hypothetical protein
MLIAGVICSGWLLAAGLPGLESYLTKRTYKATAYYIVPSTVLPWNATETNGEVQAAIDQHNLIVAANVTCDDPITRLDDVVIINTNCGVRVSSITSTIASDPLLPARSAIIAIRTLDETELDEAAFPPNWFTVSAVCIAISGTIGIMSISAN